MTRRSVETIVAALEQAGVRYLIVGGLAVVAHGYVRFTADLDLVLDPEPGNLGLALAVFEAQGYVPRAPVPFRAFLDPAQRQRWQSEKGMVVFSASSPLHEATELDLFLEPPFDFAVAWERGVRLELEPGVQARFAALRDLRDMKRKAGRDIDRFDLEALARLHPEDPE